MPRSDCQVCASPNRVSIDLALQSGDQQLKDLAATFDVSKYALSRHRQRHLEVPAVPEEGVSDDSQEIEKWLGRAEQIFQTSVVDHNLKGMVDSLAAALRSLEVRAKTREREAEAAAELREQGGDVPPISVAQLDSLLEKFDEQVRREGVSAPARWLSMQVQIGKRPDGNKVLDLVQRLLDDSTLLTAMRQMIAEPHLETWSGLGLAGIPGPVAD